MTILEEIENEVWFILVSIYTHQELMSSLTTSQTRYELGNQFVTLNALTELLILRIARLADRTKGVRSIAMLLKRGTFQASTADMQLVADKFYAYAASVVKIRHEQIAHMKPGTLSIYGPREIPNAVLRGTEILVELIDLAKGSLQSYIYTVGSQESDVDLRASVMANKRIFVN